MTQEEKSGHWRLEGLEDRVLFATTALLAPPPPAAAADTTYVKAVGPAASAAAASADAWTIFSPEWREAWQAALAANHPWARLLIRNADLSGTSGQRASDELGNWGLLAYQLTGDVKYADKSWAITSGVLGSQGPNELREWMTERALIYYGFKQGGYWDLPGNDTKQDQMIASMNGWADQTLRVVSERRDDSDATVGALGVLLWGLVSQGENPKAAGYLSNPLLGGLTPTGDNDNTVRNAVAQFCRKAAGGQWIEASDYNLGTMKLLIMATEGIRTLTGRDYFPEATALYKQVALAQIAEITPDLKQAYQWGDEEWARSLKLFGRETLLGMLAGATRGDPTVGPYVQRLVVDLAQKYGYTGDGSAEPWGRLFYQFDPAAPQADWRTLPEFAAPAGGVAAYDASGEGFTYLREGTDANSAFVGLMSYNDPHVDHHLPYMSDFQIYRKGEWALTHPLVYGPGPLVANTTLVGGLGKMSEASGRVGYDIGPNGSYAYSAASTGGNYGYPGYYNPPKTFLHESTRSLFYLPGDGPDGVPTLVAFDRINADKPTANGFPADVWNTISSSPLKQAVIHSPVTPTVGAAAAGTSGSLAWRTAGGQDVRVSLLTPGWNTQVVSESGGIIGGYAQPSELRYLTRITPAAYHKFDTLLSVMQATDGGEGSALTNLPVASSGGEAKGALVRRAGLNDALVLFSARMGSDLPPADDNGGLVYHTADVMARIAKGRLHHAGFNVPAVTFATAASDVYLTDLDPTLRWSATVDGQAAALSVSDAGVGHLTVTGAGEHSITVSVVGVGAGPLVTAASPGAADPSDPSATVATVTFDQAVDPASITFTLTGPGGDAVPATLAYDAATRTASLTPLSPLAADAAYTATVGGAVSTSTGQAMASAFSWSFMTEPGDATPDTTPPQVAEATFIFDASPQGVRFRFSEDVSSSLSLSDLRVFDSVTQAEVPLAGYSYDAATNTATFTFRDLLTRGRFRAEFETSGVVDRAGNPLSGVGGAFGYDFFFMPGDANRDGVTNFNDLIVLARNYYSTADGLTLADGDFNMDGVVNFNDLLILARNYGQSVGAPASVAASADPAFAASLLASATAPASGTKPVKPSRRAGPVTAGAAVHFRPRPARPKLFSTRRV